MTYKRVVAGVVFIGAMSAALPLVVRSFGECSKPGGLTDFTCDEIALLTEDELIEEASSQPPVASEFEKTVSSSFLKGNVLERSRYVYVSNGAAELPVSPDLPRPVLKIDTSDLLEPVFRAEGGSPRLQLHIEVDTSPDFNSDDVWRWPALTPQVEVEDLKSASGSALRVFHFRSFDTDPLVRKVKAPFPVVLMASRRTSDDPLMSLEVKSRLVGILSQNENEDREVWIAQKIYKYILHSYLIGNDTRSRSPIETFVARVGECGSLNALAQAMLEFNGIRSRFVGGFNPTVRQAYPGGGHTLLEVRYQDHWGILDTYLDVFAPDLSVVDLESSPLGDRVVYEIDNARFPAAIYGEHLDLKSLFRYRVYADPVGRLPLQTMVHLAGDEEAYGLSWNLRTGYGLTDRMIVDALPEETTIYVRARFIESKCLGGWHNDCQDPDARASEWSVSSFRIAPRTLLAEYLY